MLNESFCVFSLKAEIWQGCLKIVLVVLTNVVRQERGIKGIKIGKDKAKIPPFANNIILCFENPKQLNEKLLYNSVR